MELPNPKKLCDWERNILDEILGEEDTSFPDFNSMPVFPEVPVAISSPKRSVVQRTSPAPSASSSSSSSSSSSTYSIAKPRMEVDMQMLQKFSDGVTAALNRLTKAVEKQTAELQRIASHLKRPRSRSPVHYHSHTDKRFRR